MEPIFWTAVDGFLRLGIALVELGCAGAILFRFRAQLMRALPAALGFAGYALLDTVSVVERGLTQTMVLGPDYWDSIWFQAYSTGSGCLALTAGVAIAIGLALVATARTEASS